MAYDDNNVFAKILRGEIPCNTVYEDEYALAFHDIQPQSPVHVLVIPKGPYVSMDDFCNDAPSDLIAGYFRAVGTVARQLGVVDQGYRFLSNTGPDAHQEVMHL
ncbi:MAG: HIT domain-containing protein, partial [Rhodospirillales bacterium]|nr:HIT domain-containing protein [Rhodospirillales bacterium]